MGCISFFAFFEGACASSEIFLDLVGCVDPEVNIERIDSGGTLNIFDQNEARFRVTSNVDKDVKVSFKAQNGWKLRHKDNPEKFVPYEGLFKRNNRVGLISVNRESESVNIDKNDFVDKEYEFGVIFRSTAKIKTLKAGDYYGRVTISVSYAD